MTENCKTDRTFSLDKLFIYKSGRCQAEIKSVDFLWKNVLKGLWFESIPKYHQHYGKQVSVVRHWLLMRKSRESMWSFRSGESKWKSWGIRSRNSFYSFYFLVCSRSFLIILICIFWIAAALLLLSCLLLILLFYLLQLSFPCFSPFFFVMLLCLQPRLLSFYFGSFCRDTLLCATRLNDVTTILEFIKKQLYNQLFVDD